MQIVAELALLEDLAESTFLGTTADQQNPFAVVTLPRAVLATRSGFGEASKV